MKQKYPLQWLSAVTGRAKGLVGLLVVVQTVLSVSSIAFAFVLRRIINMAVDGARGGFWASLALLMGILLGQIVLSAAGRFLSEYTSATVENRFKHRLFSALLTGDYASVAAVHSGEWMNRLTSDTTVVAGGVTQIVPGLIGMLVRLLGAVAAILWLEPRFLYILLPGGAAMMLLTYAFRKILKRLHKKIQETDGALRVFLQERLESLVIVRTFAKEEQMAQQADTLMDAHKAARMKRSNFSNLCNIGFAGAMDGAYLLGIGFCGYGILTGTMSYGNLMAIMQLVGQVQSPFANLTGYLPRYYSMLASAERLMEAEAFAPDSTETVPEEQSLHFYQTELQSLQLEHVCFTYQPPVQTEGEAPAMPVVLQDVSLTVRKGEYVVFTGPSGCGKSTLLKLLMCLYPLDSGQRFLSTKSGNQPLTSAWKSLFAYVPQGNQLLSGSIRSIVAFGDEDRAQDENAIYNALKIACADDFAEIDKLAAEHSITPVIFLDCSQEKEQLTRILKKAVAEDYEVVLAGLQFDESILQTADEMKDLLVQMDDTKSPAFLLRNKVNTEENRNLLNEHGYTELILYDASLQADMQENGKPYICYGFFKQPAYYADYISQVVTAHTMMLASFDFSTIQSGTLQISDVERFMTLTDDRKAANELRYVDLNSAFQAVADQNATRQERQESYEKYEAEQEKRIQELEEEISAIYSRWDEY